MVICPPKLTPHCKELKRKRLDENKNVMETAFVAEFNNSNGPNKARAALHAWAQGFFRIRKNNNRSRFYGRFIIFLINEICPK